MICCVLALLGLTAAWGGCKPRLVVSIKWFLLGVAITLIATAAVLELISLATGFPICSFHH